MITFVLCIVFRSNEGGDGSWPSSLREYVEKTFAQCESDAERDSMEISLKLMIKESISKGDLWKRNWTNFPLMR